MPDQEPAQKRPQRPFIGMHFKCCNAYARVYLNAAGNTFAGHCPRCARPVRIKVGKDGSRSRFWTAE